MRRQVGNLQALDRQRHWRATEGTSKDEHGIVRLHVLLHVGRQRYADLQRLNLGVRLGCSAGLLALSHLLAGTFDTTGDGRTGRILLRQHGDQTLPVAHGIGIALAFVGSDTQQTEAGDLFRISLQRFVGKRLQSLAPLFAFGKIQRLRPLAEQFRGAPGDLHGTLEGLGGIAGTLLCHIGTTEEIPGLGGVRLLLHGLFQARGHLLDALRLRSGQLASLYDLIDSAPMQVQGNPQHRHQQCRHQRNLAAEHAAAALHAFGIIQQLARRLGTTGLHLRFIEHASLELVFQLLQALLIEGDVECGTVFFGLQLANTQYRNQQKSQGSQQQQPGGQPEIDHRSLLS